MNTQPSAEEQVTVNVMFIEGDQYLISPVVAAWKLNRWPDNRNPLPQTYVRVHISCAHMGRGADKAAHART